jgi:hypothetical protein
MTKGSPKKKAKKSEGRKAPGISEKRKRTVFDPRSGADLFQGTKEEADRARAVMVGLSVRGSTARQYESRLRVVDRWLEARKLTLMTKSLCFVFLAELRSQGMAESGYIYNSKNSRNQTSYSKSPFLYIPSLSGVALSRCYSSDKIILFLLKSLLAKGSFYVCGSKCLSISNPFGIAKDILKSS